MTVQHVSLYICELFCFLNKNDKVSPFLCLCDDNAAEIKSAGSGSGVGPT